MTRRISVIPLEFNKRPRRMTGRYRKKMERQVARVCGVRPRDVYYSDRNSRFPLCHIDNVWAMRNVGQLSEYAKKIINRFRPPATPEFTDVEVQVTPEGVIIQPTP